MSSTHPIEDVVVTCSFCGKPNHQVSKIVAGPGVYICDECVELSATIIAESTKSPDEEPASRRQSSLHLSSEEILSLLPALVRSATRVEAELARWVQRLREQNTDWLTIANALGTEVEQTHQRFGARPDQ